MAQTALITDEKLWDRIGLLSTTAPTELTFFAVPLGQADAVYGTKTQADTNMTTASKLGTPESFTIKSLQIVFDFATAQADVVKLMNTAWVELYTANGQIRAWQSPLRDIQAGTGFAYTDTTGNTPAQNGYASPHAIKEFKNPIEIFIDETFFVKLKVSATQSLSAAVKVSCLLGGDHFLTDAAGPWGPSRGRAARALASNQ